VSHPWKEHSSQYLQDVSLNINIKYVSVRICSQPKKTITFGVKRSIRVGGGSDLHGRHTLPCDCTLFT